MSPSLVASRAVAAKAAPPKFELPALNLNFGNITDGTNIPPPLASPLPRVPTPPQTPPGTGKKEVVALVADKTAAADGLDQSFDSCPSAANFVGTKRSADGAPLSPAGSGRQGSLRRLFSRTMLNASYAEGRLSSPGNASLPSMGRPESRGAASVMDDRKSKRSSGWFSRLRGGEFKRSSVFFDDSSSSVFSRKPCGPPPPMIPELADLEKENEGLGVDLFKNIK
ncbi:hypothetical protein DCS_01090 [Drechmeria coniospora]|uniref:Uncharacterized protein n=1 Tax=Drechmeria coniospora TaxID=98403 RepID=A0A151GS63_DRECN|nr:hypothetical protein DCS_01090 [Drechmeria coniospora]KYK59956.1 hypothetical protein DCS_01090 [Drechmeria coniospora]ODA78751.1 hypothetical protein RJ55_06134 [Drechmeria coniospora]